MSNKILVTDSLFISDENVKELEKAGFKVERLDKPKATEKELVQAIKGKAGYILGGVEYVSKKIIDAGDQLKIISFTGIGYKDFIDWKYATEKGVAITNTPDGPTQAVGEWAIGAMLLMNCKFLEFGKFGDKTFGQTIGVEGLNIGIIGLGRTGG